MSVGGKRRGNSSRLHTVALWAGPALALAMLLSSAPAGISHLAWSTAAVGVLMVV